MTYIPESDASMTSTVYLVNFVQYALCTRCAAEARSDENDVRYHLTLAGQVKCDNCKYREQVGIVQENSSDD